MSDPGATPLFVDTGAFFAHFVRNAPRHERARAVFDGIRTGELHYRPVYTTGYVLGELTTLVLRKKDHETALDTLRRVRESPAVTVLHPDAGQFAVACEEFARFDDQQLSFVDHLTGAVAADYDVECVFAFDSDFRTLGFTLVPDDVEV